MIFKPFNALPSGLPASTVENGKAQLLPLDLQFFAEPGTDGKDPKDPPAGTDPKDPPADPPGTGEDDLTLADLLKTNPKIKQDMNERIEKAIKKRFNGIDPEEAKVAIAEKAARDAAGESFEQKESDTVKALNGKVATLETAAKELGVATYAAKEGLDANLILRLAGKDVGKLQLDDNAKVDPEDVADIVDDLKAEFPDLFTVKVDPADPADPPPAGNQRRRKTAGPNTQHTNTPPPATGQGPAKARASLERLKNRGRI